MRFYLTLGSIMKVRFPAFCLQAHWLAHHHKHISDNFKRPQVLLTQLDQPPHQVMKCLKHNDKKTIDIIKELQPEQIHQRLSNQEKLKFGLRSGSITPLNMVLDTTFPTKLQEFSSTTQQKLCLIQMVTISITWREDQVIDKMLETSTLYKNIQRSCRRKLPFFNISGVTSKEMTVLKLL